MFYQNGADHQGFIYQNPSYTNNEYANPASERVWDIKKDLPLATIYVRPQVYNGINSPHDALKQGTAFVELYRPFVGKGGQS